jgi:hypothetical protein
MSKKPILMFVQPIDRYFGFQIHMYIESCIEVGFDEERIHVLMYCPKGRDRNMELWNKINACYPKVKFFFYEDNGAQQLLGIYLPVLRPHVLWQHFQAFPELEKETIIYTDCDILWVSPPDIEKFYDDDVCYMSDAKSYLNVDYFNSKIKDVLPEKLEEYKLRDPLEEICKIVGIPKTKAIENNNNSGGVQYILKHLNGDFWKKVQDDVISIKIHLGDVNKKFFENENKGIQSWCADLWAIMFNLWYKNLETKVVPELLFSWATDSIDRIKTCSIFHNAGITDAMQWGVPRFYKGKYHRGEDPTKDPHLDVILNNEESKKTCTWYYTNKLKELSLKYKIDY